MMAVEQWSQADERTMAEAQWSRKDEQAGSPIPESPLKRQVGAEEEVESEPAAIRPTWSQTF